MTNKVRVNVTSTVNNDKIRSEDRSGRQVIVVPSATLPDNVVMNGIKYPADEIAKSFESLNDTLAPFGHPEMDGIYLSAQDVDGLARSYIGAHNENARRENGRVFLDKVIDVEVANQSENGRSVLEAIDKGDPISTSTGLIADLEEIEDGDAKFIARNLEFDHDAILLNEAPAATPEQGVGMLVNKKAIINGEEIQVFNSSLDDAMRELDWAAEYALSAIEKVERQPILERIKTAIKEALSSERTNPATNEGDAEMADDKRLEGLSAKVDELADNVGKINEAITNAVAEAVKPLTDNLAEIQANQKAKDDAELSDLTTKIVNANLMSQESAGELTLNAARELAKQAMPGVAAPVNGAFIPNTNEGGEYLLPDGE